MKLSKKCQYALKAVFELAWRNNGEPIKTQEIAKAQNVSVRFMEIILNDLKHGGFVESRRGNEGGYILARNAKELNIQEIIDFIEGPITFGKDNNRSDIIGNEAFKNLWIEISNSIKKICLNKSFEDLVKFERNQQSKFVLNYNI